MKLEDRIAALLRYGTWLASSLIGLGLVLTLIEAVLGAHALAGLPAMHFVTLGIAVFILLPVSRVLLMLAVLLWDGDYRLAGVAAVVLAVVSMGFWLGVRWGAAAH